MSDLGVSAGRDRGIPAYAMLDVWMALGGTPDAFDRMWEEDRRTPADTWAQLLEVVRGGDLADDHNPPAGPEFEALIPVTVDRGTPGIEAAVRAGVNAVQEEFDERGLGTAELLVEVILDEALPAFLAAEPPAEILRRTLEAQPEAFRAALTEMLTSDEAVAAGWDRYAHTDPDVLDPIEEAIAAAVASLKPKEDEG